MASLCGHPFFFKSALLRVITLPEIPVVNFATSHVSLGNSSYHAVWYFMVTDDNKIEIEPEQQLEKGIFDPGNILNQ